MRYTILAIAIVVSAAMLSFSYAQELERQDSLVVPALEGMVDDLGLQGEQQTGQAVASRASGTVTLDFREADMRNVLRILAYRSGVNIVPGPEVTGLVTIQLSDVPWEQALNVILETHGYGYERDGNVIVVTTIDNLKKRREDRRLLSDQEALTTRTIVLNFAKATDAIKSIERMVTSRGNAYFDERTNALIIRDTPTNLAIIEGIIPNLDTPTPQVLIEAKIIQTTLSNAENLGVDWVVKAGASGSRHPHTWPFTQSSENKYLPDDFPGAASANFVYGTLDLGQLTAVVELLRSRTDTNILSNPRIVTMDNKPATINVGTQYPFPQYTYNEEQARLQISGWEYKDIGILFQVTPHVNKAGFVTLDIEPRVTEISGTTQVESTLVPVLSNESVKTRVMIKEGETLVIAGLIKDNIVDKKKKVPFIGDIPVLGWFFTKSEKEIKKTDLLIFVTPYIITPEWASDL